MILSSTHAAPAPRLAPASARHHRARSWLPSRSLAIALVFLVGGLSASAPAQACSVPVFRYALDHWSPDSYRIHVLHRGAMSDQQNSLVTQLRERVARNFANAVVEVLDVEGVVNPSMTALIERFEGQDLPLCVLEAPTAMAGVLREVMTAPLSTETVAAILESPIRKQLADHLVAGTSAVWIYLEAGLPALDNANFAMLERELQRLESELELPEIDPADLKELSTSPDEIKLHFRAIRLSRDSEREAALVHMLLASEPDLRDATFEHEPMAFPVFGRGRVLYSLVGKGINPDTIEEACRFLTGACQCTVKAQNPGVDLLMSVDWDGVISPAGPVEVDVTLTGLAAFQSDASQQRASELLPVVETLASVPEDPPAPSGDVVPTGGAASEAEPVAVDSAPPTRPDTPTGVVPMSGWLVLLVGCVAGFVSLILVRRR